MSEQARSRAAILPFPGDPFLLNYWLMFFDRFWGEEVDKLYIVLNSPIEEPVRRYIREICSSRPKIVLFEFPNQIDHGPCINFALDKCVEKYIMLVEDDGFIFKKGIVDFAFLQLESGKFDIVGSKRASCSEEITRKAQEIWGLSYEGEGDQGPNFWPNFFFCAKELLLKTDRNFSAKCWKKGEVIPALGLTIQGEVANGDTFVNTSLQLRTLVPEARIYYLPQYHGHPEDLAHYLAGRYLFDGRAPWTHVGSLSSGINGLLKDSNDRELAQRTTKLAAPATILPKQYCQSEMEHREFERRVQWWLTAIEYFEGHAPNREMADFANLYYDAVMQLIQQFGLSIKAIKRRQIIYNELMKI
jgi:hypothetical protein